MPDAPDPSSTDAVDRALTSRRSVRHFLPDEVDRALVEDILAVASRAASGTNVQPWRVYVLRGEPKRLLSERILAVWDDPVRVAEHAEPFAYYPAEWTSPYRERRRKVGRDLYTLLGIPRGDTAGMHSQHARNFAFFDAPLGLMFTMDRALAQGSLIDYGMFLQSIMIAARGRGLDTCPQAAFLRFHRIVTESLGCGGNEMLVCGMSLGFADTGAVVNQLRTERVPVRNFASFIGFEK